MNAFRPPRDPVRIFVPFALALVAGACGGDASDGDPDSGAVLAEVAGQKITEDDVDARLTDMPALARPEFSGPIGRGRVLQKIIEEEVLYRAAVEEKIDRDESVRRHLDDYRRQFLVQAYLDRKQEEMSRVSDEEIRRFYEEHPEDYTTERTFRVRMLLCNEKHAAENARRIFKDKKLSFQEVCSRYSDDPGLKEVRGLLPTWVRLGKAVPWIGNHPRFHEVLAGLEPGEVSEVFEIPRGWVVLRIEEVREPRLRSLDEVDDDIRSRLARERSTKGLPDLLDRLKARYHVRVHEPAGRNADELFAEAQSTGDARKRVELYEELVERFPDHDLALESYFMIGFIRSEELRDQPGAAAAFEKVIAMDPDSELAQSARWMLTSDPDQVPEFEEEEAGPNAEEGSH